MILLKKPLEKRLSLFQEKYNDQDSDFVDDAPQQKRPSLSTKGKGKALLPSDRFNTTILMYTCQHN